MSDLLAILGAGASHDALREGAASPPLTKDLFSNDYDEDQRSFPGVDGLRDTILARMRQGRSLEEILGDLAANEAQDIRRQIFEVPIYLKVILGKYAGSRPGTYDTLITLAQERELSVTFVTTNYDTLIDKAIRRRYGMDGTIASISDYIHSDRRWNYIKLHGSVNWGYQTQIPESQLTNTHQWISEYLKKVRYGEVEYDKQVELLDADAMLAKNGRLIYPALAIPTNQKMDFICPEEHVYFLHSALRADPSILVIGHRGQDATLMNILKSVPRFSKKPFCVVDPSEEHGLEAARLFAKATTRRGFTVPPSGVSFRKFVESDEGVRFFDSVRAASR